MKLPSRRSRENDREVSREHGVWWGQASAQRARDRSEEASVQGIEGVILDTIHLDLPAIETAAELDARLISNARRVPRLVERSRGRKLAKLVLELEGVEGAPLRHHGRPVLAKCALELLAVHWQVFARSQRRLLSCERAGATVRVGTGHWRCVCGGRGGCRELARAWSRARVPTYQWHSSADQ
jgi:hypothetical protein